MSTARAAFSTTRIRQPAGPLRLLWVAAVLFAFLYTHVAGADSASAHVTGGTATVPHLAPADAEGSDRRDELRHDRHDDNGSDHSHPAEACASGYPQQVTALPGPHLVPLGVRTPAVDAMTPQPWTRTVPCGLPPLRSSLSSVVQQV
ncbi:hypothetical protein [Streptomyces sp. NBC_01353]|uniref:hypothetical protein n=1 Tax=Streptomyces sp. NBC_01353 TaxID=2903835 RepID=UPI002E33B23C|nr:hypothetical protein [Streptomyces sp. NBC_01353]